MEFSLGVFWQAKVELSLHWAHMSENTFPDVAVQINLQLSCEKRMKRTITIKAQISLPIDPVSSGLSVSLPIYSVSSGLSLTT